eukprot:gene7794-5558_t
MDDYGGFAISWEVLSTLRELGLRPKRTIRIIGWTAEEVGQQGALQYFEDHKHDIAKFRVPRGRFPAETCPELRPSVAGWGRSQMVAESDGGVFDPTGLAFTGNVAARAVMAHVMELLAPLGLGHKRLQCTSRDNGSGDIERAAGMDTGWRCVGLGHDNLQGGGAGADINMWIDAG